MKTYHKIYNRLIPILSALSYFICNEILNKIPSHTLRLLIYKLIFRLKIGKDSAVCLHVILACPRFIKIGDNCVINQFTYLDGRGGLSIGNNVNIARNTFIYTSYHNYHSPRWEYMVKPVIIEDNVWIASNVIIIQGVKIHEGAIIAAGAVVVKDVEPFTVVGGNPAKVIGQRGKDIKYKTKWFELFY